MRPAARAALTAATMLVAVSVSVGLRNARMAGLFSHVTPGFAGVCTPVGPIAGAGDLAIDAKDDLVFIAASNRRAPGAHDGLYGMTLAGGNLARLAGQPDDFHPRAISLFRAQDGSLTLMAVSGHTVGIFDVAVSDGAVKLAERSSVGGGLLVDPDGIAAVSPGQFYVANRTTSKSAVGRLLDDLMLPRGNLVYFDGAGMRIVVTGLSRPAGVALSPDGARLYVAATGDRTLFTFETDTMTGNLNQASTLALPAGPDRIVPDPRGDLWIAAHPSLFALADYARDASNLAASVVLSVPTANGVPGSAMQVYGNLGGEIAGASVGVVSGNRLIIGSALDDKILDCRMR